MLRVGEEVAARVAVVGRGAFEVQVGDAVHHVERGWRIGGERVPGQADSAPHKFDLPRHLIRAATTAALLTAIYVANYEFGWITVSDLDFYN